MTEGPGATLRGRRVLVVETRYLLAEEMRRTIAAAGATVVGPVSGADEALRLIADTAVDAVVDAAVLSIGIGGEAVFALADRLDARGVRLVFATGYPRAVVPARFADRPLLSKPVAPGALLAALARGPGEGEPGA